MNIRNITLTQFVSTMEREGITVYDYYDPDKEYQVFFRKMERSSTPQVKIKLFYLQDSDISIGTVFLLKDKPFVVISQDALESDIYYTSIAVQCDTTYAVKVNGNYVSVPFYVVSNKYTVSHGTISQLSGNVVMYTGMNGKFYSGGITLGNASSFFHSSKLDNDTINEYIKAGESYSYTYGDNRITISENISSVDFSKHMLDTYLTHKSVQMQIDVHYTLAEWGNKLDNSNGNNGVSPTIDVTTTETGHTVSITDVNGTKNFDVPNGTKGEKGDPGTDGRGIKSTEITYQKSYSCEDVPDGTWESSIGAGIFAGQYLWTRIVITYTDNTTSTSYSVGYVAKNGITPVRGTDYWTQEDINTIKSYIDTELGVIENGSY